MPFGLPQSSLYQMRGGISDGNAIRDRSGEQANTYSGNPNMPVFNTNYNQGIAPTPTGVPQGISTQPFPSFAKPAIAQNYAGMPNIQTQAPGIAAQQGQATYMPQVPQGINTGPAPGIYNPAQVQANPQQHLGGNYSGNYANNPLLGSYISTANNLRQRANGYMPTWNRFQ